MRNPLPFQLFFPYRKDVISLSLVSRPCFCPVFRSLTVMFLGADFFEFSYLEFTQLLESVGLYILPNLRLFQLSFLCILLKSYLLSPFFETLMTGVLEIFYYSPSSPWDAIQFYFVWFLSVVVIFQSSSSLVFLLFLPFCYWMHQPSFKISAITFLNFIGSSCLLFLAETLFLWWGFLFILFVCFKHVIEAFFKVLVKK